MATIKSFTDLQQSKTLSKILPIESADMYWWYSGKRYYIEAMDDGDFNAGVDIRAWSLASLLNVLQNPSLHKTYTGWRCDTYNENCTECKLGDTADNPVDACYELILKLHELKML